MGHGWVTPNPDGLKARCGGPAICDVCREELAQLEFSKQRPGQALGDAPVQSETHQLMRAIVQAIDKLLNGKAGGPGRKWGFVLMVTEIGNVGRCNYMSNGLDRKDVATMMKEQIKRFEGMPEPPTGRG